VTYGGADVVSVSLVKPVTYTLDAAADGRLQLDTSEIDAVAAFHFGRVPGTRVDEAWREETYRVRFNGGRQTLKLSAVGKQVAVKVVNGSFGVEAVGAGRSVVASGGLCLIKPEPPPAMQTVPLLQVLAAVPCP